MTEDEAKAILCLAGIKFGFYTKIPNERYLLSDVEMQISRPWWVFSTDQFGPLKIGWRKSVINIEWSKFDISKDKPLTSNVNITQSTRGIHAWSHSTAVEYLTELRKREALERARSEAKTKEETK